MLRLVLQFVLWPLFLLFLRLQGYRWGPRRSLVYGRWGWRWRTKWLKDEDEFWSWRRQKIMICWRRIWFPQHPYLVPSIRRIYMQVVFSSHLVLFGSIITENLCIRLPTMEHFMHDKNNIVGSYFSYCKLCHGMVLIDVGKGCFHYVLLCCESDARQGDPFEMSWQRHLSLYRSHFSLPFS